MSQVRFEVNGRANMIQRLQGIKTLFFLFMLRMQVVVLFMNHIFKLHGLPQAIVLDRDKIFTSNLWRELFKLLGSELHMSSAYQP